MGTRAGGAHVVRALAAVGRAARTVRPGWVCANSRLAYIYRTFVRRCFVIAGDTVRHRRMSAGAALADVGGAFKTVVIAGKSIGLPYVGRTADVDAVTGLRHIAFVGDRTAFRGVR